MKNRLSRQIEAIKNRAFREIDERVDDFLREMMATHRQAAEPPGNMDSESFEESGDYHNPEKPPPPLRTESMTFRKLEKSPPKKKA